MNYTLDEMYLYVYNNYEIIFNDDRINSIIKGKSSWINQKLNLKKRKSLELAFDLLVLRLFI